MKIHDDVDHLTDWFADVSYKLCSYKEIVSAAFSIKSRTIASLRNYPAKQQIRKRMIEAHTHVNVSTPTVL